MLTVAFACELRVSFSPQPAPTQDGHRAAAGTGRMYLTAQRAGIAWDSDNDTEIELLVCCIIDAVEAMPHMTATGRGAWSGGRAPVGLVIPSRVRNPGRGR